MGAAEWRAAGEGARVGALHGEPTNHLDLAMRDALTLALQDYAGALVVVSHDRYLLRTLTDRFLLVAEGRVEPFDGGLED